jgi:hypothetical protein
VVANAPIHEQILQALDLSTHGRVTDWYELADDEARTVRIVLLDGLDELLQATTHDRSGFLHEVMEFQRAEAAQERPVMVVVTSRTVCTFGHPFVPDGHRGDENKAQRLTSATTG